MNIHEYKEEAQEKNVPGGAVLDSALFAVARLGYTIGEDARVTYAVTIFALRAGNGVHGGQGDGHQADHHHGQGETESL